MTRVLVQGCGLIGTSIGLALRGQATVLLTDVDERHVAAAVARGAGEAWDTAERVDLLVVATPPRHVADLLHSAQSRDIARTYTHVASVQSQVQREVEALECDLSSIVGGHPMAGREASGPLAATSDLFVGRPWAVCAGPTSSPAAVAAVHWLAAACGATAVDVAEGDHDTAVALLSHLPQVTASALAGLLVPRADDAPRTRAARGVAPTSGTARDEGSAVQGMAGPATAGGAASPVLPGPVAVSDTGPAASPEVTAVLSGPGLVDTTRLAASDALLWTDILTLNASRVAPVVRELAGALDDLALALDAYVAFEHDPAQRTSAASAVQRFLERGNAGRALVPVKRGEVSEAFDRVGVSVDDKPGRLAALLVAAGAAGINVEDVHVEHIPGRPQGVIELLVDRSAAGPLRVALLSGGWTVLGS